MDDLDLIRAARPPGGYPAGQRDATRAAVLAGIAEQTQAQPAGRPRLAGCWRAGLVAALAACAAMTVAVVHAAGLPARARPSRPAPVGSAGPVLELAARTTVPPPPGTRWVVTESLTTITVLKGAACGWIVQAAGNQIYASVDPGPGACPAAPPAALPKLPHAIRMKAVPPPGYPMELPDRPGPLLTALYRWLHAKPRQWLLGWPVPRVPAPELRLGAFDTLVLMITEGVTTPGRDVLLTALGQIPGAKVVRLRASPDIGVTMSVPGWQDMLIINAQNYKIVGDRDSSVRPNGQRITAVVKTLWQAYYDTSGHRL